MRSVTRLILTAVLPGVLAVSAPMAAHIGFEPQGTGILFPAAADGNASAHPSIQAHPLNGNRIELDGRLDEAAWQEADAGRGFKQWSPERGAPASEPTVFKVAYDDEAVFFGVACYDSDPSRISSNLGRRDHISASDAVYVCMDPYHDKTTGYFFRVNPHGVQEDAYLSDDGDREDGDWDAVWEAKTNRDEEGWYVEMRIPFSSMRFRPAANMTWGLQVLRSMHQRGEETSWVCWDREDPGFISRFGALEGLRNVDAPRQLELMPYVVSRAEDPSDPFHSGFSAEEWDFLSNTGIDLKYGLTADLTLNATIQPDFGQVEVDPAVLNLSPFETFYQEKRPFFIEGGRFFQHPDFNLFYSRRIGTGTENSRIRFASKLLGKTAGDILVATLVAATDETAEGQSHNPFKSGHDRTWYGVTRFGKEFCGGRHSINLMQTAVLRDEDSFLGAPTRDAYSTGLDFRASSADRRYVAEGSFVGTIVDPSPVPSDPTASHDPRYGSGGGLGFHKQAGTWQAGATAGWESDKLDPNDLGYLSSPDQINSNVYIRYHYNSDGEDALFTNGNTEVSFRKSWLYAGRSVEDPARPSQALWSYGPGVVETEAPQIDGYWQMRNFWQFWYGVWFTPDGQARTATRDWVRGPLMIEPEGWGGWGGVHTDNRKSLHSELGYSIVYETRGTPGTYTASAYLANNWVQSSAMQHTLMLEYAQRHDDQWVGNFADDDPTAGIGGVHYVFGMIDQKTWECTLRSNLLLSAKQSIELYLQPFLTVGSYSSPRELMQPATYDLRPYTADGFDIRNRDFSYGAVNLNMVYRWEYLPGSTLYLVWTHSRGSYDQRGFHADPAAFGNSFATDPLLDNEPENTFLAKVSYWFAM